jgi:hypothetical protein
VTSPTVILWPVARKSGFQGRSESVRVMARDEGNDLALLKLPGGMRAAAVLTPVAAVCDRDAGGRAPKVGTLGDAVSGCRIDQS